MGTSYSMYIVYSGTEAFLNSFMFDIAIYLPVLAQFSVSNYLY